ncbi:MAG: hypothetical protein M1337_05350 [Actinobacteria bacterium]|nr:hypothetical protein [Actinomycetota bacterium]
MATTITCYGGVGEVGGNKLLLEDGARRVLMDFGRSFGRYGSYFDGVFIKERIARGLLDPLALGLIPPLRGLLREDMVPILDPAELTSREIAPVGKQRKPRQHVAASDKGVEAFWNHFRIGHPSTYRDLRRADDLSVDLILLSHAHQDHIGDLEYVTPDVPTCSSRMTAFISKVLLDTGQSGRSGAAYVNPRSLDEHGILKAAKDESYIARPWIFLDGAPEGEVQDDALANPASFWSVPSSKRLEARAAAPSPGVQLRHYPLDHSLFGATGYAIETEAGWVAYTGDLRFHGARAELSWKFAEAMSQLRPVALLCEGTRLAEDNETTEAEVYGRCLEAVRRFGGHLVVADFAPRNVERLLAFLAIATETGRRLLLQPKDAYLLRAMHLADPSAPDVMSHVHVGLYADPKAREQIWEENVRARYRSSTIGPRDVAAHPGDYLLAFSLTDVSDMLDLQLIMGDRPGGAYIFSNSRAYDDEQMVDLVRLWNWTAHLGLELIGLTPVSRGDRGEVVELVPEPGYHASGHAGAGDLAELVRRVQPRSLIPIHTEMPGAWARLLDRTGIGIILPDLGRPIAL